jgi:deazaflavin-dependent oxidoreductase (nitroreductase family)
METGAAFSLGVGMGRDREVKRRMVTWFQRRIGNPVLVRMPGRTVLETTGRKSGEKRRTPIGGRQVGGEFWLVSEYGEQSQYVRNIKADPKVRVRIRGRWRDGIAHLMPEDDAKARLRSLPVVNSAGVRMLGTNLLTIRVELTGR